MCSAEAAWLVTDILSGDERAMDATGHAADVRAVLADLNIGILFILAISSLGVYGVALAGWASNS